MTKLVSEERLGSLRRMNDATWHCAAKVCCKLHSFLAWSLVPIVIAPLVISSAAVSIYVQPTVPDTIFVGQILTLDPSHPKAEAIAVSAGRIVAIGSHSEVEALATENTRKIRINGVAVPGFADAHIHVAGVGEQLEKLNLRGLILPLYLMNKVPNAHEK